MISGPNWPNLGLIWPLDAKYGQNQTFLSKIGLFDPPYSPLDPPWGVKISFMKPPVRVLMILGLTPPSLGRIWPLEADIYLKNAKNRHFWQKISFLGGPLTPPTPRNEFFGTPCMCTNGIRSKTPQNRLASQTD